MAHTTPPTAQSESAPAKLTTRTGTPEVVGHRDQRDQKDEQLQIRWDIKGSAASIVHTPKQDYEGKKDRPRYRDDAGENARIVKKQIGSSPSHCANNEKH